MNWEAIGAIGEVLGALAVLLTLLYLAVQIRQNTLTAKATIRENRTTSSQNMLLALKDEYALLFKTGEFTDEEQFQFDMLMGAMLRDAEAYAYQRQLGLLDESEWSAMEATWKRAFASQRLRDSWARNEDQFSAALREHVDRYLQDEATTP